MSKGPCKKAGGNGEDLDPFQIFAQIFGQSLFVAPGEPEPPEQPRRPKPNLPNAKSRQVQMLTVASIKPAPENDQLYKAIAWDDPEILELARSIKERGIQEPILISRDGYIISGHRRRIAATIAELELVPVRVHPISREQDREGFRSLLNSQRIKSASELLHETLVKINPKEAHEQIVNERKKKESERLTQTNLCAIDPEDDGRRCVISNAKIPFLHAIIRVLNAQRDYWPLSDRQIHYRLLGEDAPLTHASKSNSRYRNNIASYRSLTDLLARARIAEIIPWEAIEDSTRPTDLHAAFWNTAEFFRDQFNNFLKGYWRNRQQSQPHHIEIVAEKLTVRTILQQVAQEFTIPLTISRGMSSLPPKKAIAQRYKVSQKDRLILLVVSDLDPAGDAIAEDLVKSFRRDFNIQAIEAYKVALSIDQVSAFNLAPSMEAKDTSPTYAAFVGRYEITDAYELEALAPSDLAGILQTAINEVLDIDLYNQELAAEETDSAHIMAVRARTAEFFKSLSLDT